MDSGVGVRRRKGRAVDTREEEETTSVHGSVGWSKAVCWSLALAIFLLPVVLWLIPAPVEPMPFVLPPPPEWTGPLAANQLLQKAHRLFEGEILGPESLVADGDYLYTGTADGKIVEIYKGNMRVLTRLGKEPCGKFEDEPTCGRPLGMRIDKDGYLIVADAYLGLFKVNVATGDAALLWPSSAPINGQLPRFLNDLDFGPDGTIYLTDSSTRWDRRHNRYLVIEGDNSGRLLAYHPTTNTTEELVSGIRFANGVQLTQDKKHVLIVSTTMAAVYRYHLEGPDKGKLDTFCENLPGLPDNIRWSPSTGGYWLGMASASRKPSFSLIDVMSQRPWLSRLFTKLLSQEALIQMMPKHGLLILLNDKGEIVRTLHDPTASKVAAVSEAEERNGVLYLGSYGLPYLSKLYLTDVKG